MIRILIADDHEVVRAGLRKVLEVHDDWEIVGEAANGAEAVNKAVETAPDVAILDYSMPVVNGLEATRRIRARLPKIEVLIFSMYDNEAVVKQLLQAGVRGFVLKADAKAELIRSVEAIARGRPTSQASQRRVGAIVERRGSERSDLTCRQRRSSPGRIVPHGLCPGGPEYPSDHMSARHCRQFVFATQSSAVRRNG